MTLFGIRDQLVPHSCPRCKSKETQRIGRNSGGERIIHCEKCQYYGVVNPSAELLNSYQAACDNKTNRKSDDGGES
jgi:ribosomal protein L37AE/L43A